jgi:hypothetical protein
MKKYLIIILCSVIKIFGQQTNINISNTSLFAGEPYLVINPTNKKNIIVGWMASDFSTGFKMSIKTKTSFDGGVTWTNQHIKPHFSPNWGSADVSMAFRKNGTVYLSYIDFRENPDSGGVYITNSTNGGITWSIPIRAWNANTEDPGKRPLDRPWLAVDNSTTTSQGTFYLTTKPAPWIPAPNRAYLKKSSDSAQSWSNYRYIDTTNFLIGPTISGPMAHLCVASDGALCIAYPSYLNSQSIFPKYIFAKSYNKGASFQRNDLFVSPPTTPPQANYKLVYNICANPNNANQLAFSFINSPNGDPDAFVTTSNNGGLTWNSPLRINDDPLSNGKGQDLLWTTYSDNNKILSVWRDKRNGTGTGFYQPSDIYCSVSNDNGLTFQPNIKLTTISASHDTILTLSGNDMLSCALLNDTIYAAWGDVRTGFLNIYFTKLSIVTGVGIKINTINTEDANLITVYPNPTKEKISVLFRSDKIKQITFKIYDMLGKEIITKQIQNKENEKDIFLNSLNPGTYFIKGYQDEKLIYTEKIIVSF